MMMKRVYFFMALTVLATLVCLYHLTLRSEKEASQTDFSKGDELDPAVLSNNSHNSLREKNDAGAETASLIISSSNNPPVDTADMVRLRKVLNEQPEVIYDRKGDPKRLTGGGMSVAVARIGADGKIEMHCVSTEGGLEKALETEDQ